jgi:hypothetical protein
MKVFYNDTVFLHFLIFVLIYIIGKTFGSEWWQALKLEFNEHHFFGDTILICYFH